jgi:hypothetical protein
MSKGHVFVAQNSNINYVRQAYALALSIKANNKINRTCIITNDEIPNEYIHAFDHVVKIPWSDLSERSSWKIENRWKVIYASPFDKSLVYDTDMILLDSNDHLWDFLENKDLCFTSLVKDYRYNLITSDHYRKTFTSNNLSNVYTGLFYFNKSKQSYDFFKWLEIIVNNWSRFYIEHLKKHQQDFCSIDVSASLALKFMNCENLAGNSPLSFTHMKPAIQGWKNIPHNWSSVLSTYMDNNCTLKVGNYTQRGLFHYVEDEFLTDDIILKIKNKL